VSMRRSPSEREQLDLFRALPGDLTPRGAQDDGKTTRPLHPAGFLARQFLCEGGTA
jgi:plasmid replication initiation protein